MTKGFFQKFLGKSFENCFVKNMRYSLVLFLVLSSCYRYRDDSYYYKHYPDQTFTPNSRYYSKPYALSPPKHPFFDYDQYYVLPYGYGQDKNGFPIDSR